MCYVQPEKKAQNNVEICKPCLMGKFNCKRDCLTSDGWCIPVYKKISSLDFFDLNVKFIF